MSSLQIWIIESTHIKPNDFFVKVDGSPSYKAYWVTQTHSAQKAETMMLEASAELELGEIAIIQTIPYLKNTIIHSPEITKKIEGVVSKFQHHEDVQLGAWVSSEGGLW